MATDLELPGCVPDLRERSCRRCFEPLPTGPPATPEDRGQKPEARSPKPEVGATAQLTCDDPGVRMPLPPLKPKK